MKRVPISPRSNLARKALKNKVFYADEIAITWSDCESEKYWTEEAKLVLSQNAEKEFLEATYQLHNMHLVAVEKVVNDDKLMTLFNINKKLWPAIRHSWKEKQTDF